MKNNLLKEEFLAVLRNKKLLIPIIAVLFIPILYSGMFLWAFWDPYDHLKDLPVAIVNGDKGATMDGKELKLGQELVDKLKDRKDFDFHFVDKEQGYKDLKNQKYYMLVEIPKDFSKNATTLLDDNPKKLDMIYVPNESFNFLSSQIGETAIAKIKTALSTTISETYAETVFDKIGEMADGVKEASDGAGKLADGAEKIKDGNKTLKDKLTLLAEKSIEFNNGMKTANDGSAKLSTGAQTLASGMGQLQQGHQTLQGAADQLKAGNEQLNSGIGQTKAGLEQVQGKLPEMTKGTQDLSAGATKLATSLNSWKDGANSASQGAAQVNGGIKQLQDKLMPMLAQFPPAQQQALLAQLKPAFDQLLAGSQKVQDGTQTLAGYANELATGANALSAGATKLNGGQQQLQQAIDMLAAGSAKLQTGSNTIVAGDQQFQTGMQTFATKFGEAKAGADQLAAGATTLAGGVGKLTDGSNAMLDGANKLNDGSKQLADGSTTLAGGSKDLAKGLKEGSDKASSVQTTDKTYNMMAEPVKLKTEKLNKVPNYGTGFAPYFMSLGLFVGALLLSIVFPLREPIGVPRSGLSWFMSKFLILAGIGVIQALLADVILLVFLGLDVKSVPLFILFTIVTSLTYITLVQCLVTIFNDPGRFMAIIVLILQLTASAGTFPLELIPNFLQKFNAFLPMTYSVHGFKAVISSGDFSDMWSSVAKLVIFIAIFVIGTLGYFVSRHKRQFATIGEN